MRLHGLYILYATGLNPASIIFSVGCLHARRKNLDIHISVYVITAASRFLMALILFAPAAFINYSTSHCIV